MFNDAKNELAIKFKKLELDQQEIIKKLQCYKENAKINDLIIDDEQDSSLLILSNTQRESENEFINQLKFQIEELQNEKQQNDQQLSILRSQNKKQQRTIQELKTNLISTNEIILELKSQRDELLQRISKYKMMDISINQSSINNNNEYSSFITKKRSISHADNDDIQKIRKFIQCVMDMMIQLQPNIYKDKIINVQDCWKWLKQLVNQFVEVGIIVKQLKKLLNVEQQHILGEVNQLITIIIESKNQQK